MPPQIVLSSASPRRRKIFEVLQIPHVVQSADVDERALEAPGPRAFAIKAAFAKALALAEEFPKDTIIVAADTVVALDGQIYFKPEDPADARRMLGELQGQVHQVITGVAVHEVGRATQLDAVTTDVKIRTLAPQEIAEYVATGEPLDKAGSYGIQGIGGTLVEQVEGDYFNVVGLPVQRLLEMLESHVDAAPFRERLPLLTPEIFQGI